MTDPNRAPDMTNTLDIGMVAELRGEDIAAVYRYRRNYKAGHPNAFPAPDPYPVRSPLWNADRVDELKAWKPTGRGKGGGRPRKTPAPAPAPATPTETAPAHPLKPIHRQVLERLVALGESGPGWGNWVVGGHLDPDVDKYPYSTLKAMARNGHVELGTAQQEALWTSSKSFSVAKLTTNGAIALAAEITTPTVHAADLTADQWEALRRAQAGRFTRTWHARRCTWELQLDGEPAPPHAASTVTELVHMGAVLLAVHEVHVTGAGHAAAVNNLAHLDQVISKTEQQIRRAKPAAPAGLKFRYSKESGAHLADDGAWKYAAFSKEVIDAFGKRRRSWHLTAVRDDDKTSLEESTHDTKAMCLAVAQEFSNLGTDYQPEANEWRSRMTEATARAYEWKTK